MLKDKVEEDYNKNTEEIIDSYSINPFVALALYVHNNNKIKEGIQCKGRIAGRHVNRFTSAQ